jgi:hypothetical protein
MRISFDIDDTLVCDSSVPTEQFVPRWRRRQYPELMRRGTRSLMQALAERGCSIWVYTTSRREPGYLRRWFRRVGVDLDGVVTQAEHEAAIGYRGPSKCPPAFGIAMHVDDSHGVALEGELHGFHVVVIDPNDEQWAERVLDAVDALVVPCGSRSGARRAVHAREQPGL